MLFALLVALLLLALFGGGWGYTAGYGWYGLSPAAVLLVVLLALLLTGRL